MAKKRGPDTFISRLFTRHDGLRKVEGRRAREMARTMREVKDRALGLIERNMTTFREAGTYIDSAAAVSRAEQTITEIDALMGQRADWATNQVLSMRQEAWTKGVSDIEFASQRLPGNIQAKMAGSFGQIFPEAGFSAIEHPVLGVAPDAMFNGVRAGTTQNMRNVLLNAVVSGESVQETGRALSDAMDISIAAGERIARTNVNAAYNEAQRAVYDANADIIAGYAWEATFDDRTTQICFMLHGQFWPLGSKTPGPPAHWNCRSILIPVFKDPAVQAVLDATPRRARNYDKKGKRTDVLLKSATTPEQWARRQPSDITLKITGSELKNSLFRRNLIGFDDLVDPSLRVRTDQEIIKRAAALHPGNAQLQKQARAMGIKSIPSPASVARADTALAKKQPWVDPVPRPPERVAPRGAVSEQPVVVSEEPVLPTPPPEQVPILEEQIAVNPASGERVDLSKLDRTSGSANFGQGFGDAETIYNREELRRLNTWLGSISEQDTEVLTHWGVGDIVEDLHRLEAGRRGPLGTEKGDFLLEMFQDLLERGPQDWKGQAARGLRLTQKQIDDLVPGSIIEVNTTTSFAGERTRKEMGNYLDVAFDYMEESPLHEGAKSGLPVILEGELKGAQDLGNLWMGGFETGIFGEPTEVLLRPGARLRIKFILQEQRAVLGKRQTVTRIIFEEI